MDVIKVKVINKSTSTLPEYETAGAAGMDVKANLAESITIKPMERRVVPTGLYVELPEGYEMQIRPRSGLALKHGIVVANTPGTIDSDFRGEIGIILMNLSNVPFTIHNGDRVAQMVVTNYSKVEWLSVTEITKTERGEGKYGHTGI